jgi:hydroxyacylglutathione hydrolase
MHHWITKSGYSIYRVLSFRCNAFILTNKSNNILIDCGSKRYRRQLIWSLAKLGINHIDVLVLTHSHFDHAGNAKYIQTRFGAVVIIHKEEASCLMSGNSPLPKGTTMLTQKLIERFRSKIMALVKYDSCKADLTINDKFELENYGFTAYIFPSPGHSSGSVSIAIDDEIVLAGDSLFGMIPGRIKPPFADDADLMNRSWKTIFDTGARLFIPSHGKPISRELLRKFIQK